MRIAICDSDSGFLVHIKSLLEAWVEARPDSEVKTFPAGEPLIKAHTLNAFDIILLGTVLSDLNGIDVARIIRTSNTNVKLVFLASSADYAVESYAVKASNYLLKPIEQVTLLQCLDELEKEVLALERWFAFRGARSVHCVGVSSIEYLKALGRHVAVVLSNGEVIESIEPFHSLEERLFLSDGFFKCHRSYIVNINHVANFTSKEITMRSGRTIPVSRGCRSEFKETYFSVLFAKVEDEA